MAKSREDIRASLQGVGNAKVFGSGNNFRDGKYLTTVLRIVLIDGHKGSSVIVEHLVDSAESVYADVEPNRPGTTASKVFNLGNSDTRALVEGNMKAYFCALFGLDPNNTAADTVDAIIEAGTWSDEDAKRGLKGRIGPNAGKDLPVNPFRGMRIRMETARKVTTKGKNVGYDDKGRPKFVADKWTRYDQTREQVKERREELDALGA